MNRDTLKQIMIDQKEIYLNNTFWKKMLIIALLESEELVNHI